MLRSDPVSKLLANRAVDGPDLAKQPTLPRFENSIDVASLLRLDEVMLDQFIASFDQPPKQLAFDIDPFGHPMHGQQQLTFFHRYYNLLARLRRLIADPPSEEPLRNALETDRDGLPVEAPMGRERRLHHIAAASNHPVGQRHPCA